MSDRMRRVNEAMREVLSDALTQDLKDPRVGFVTVTAVETSPAMTIVTPGARPGHRPAILSAVTIACARKQRGGSAGVGP